MYNAFFEFEESPFSLRPDPAFFFRSKPHDTTLRSLIFAVQARMGVSSLVGEEGTGKTILLNCLRDTLESNQIHCAFLRDSRTSVNRLFQTISAELELQSQGTSPYQVFSALHQFTLQQARKGRTVALIVDDAHNLPADVLNEVLHLASLHDDKVKLLQTVLAGRPELIPTLDALNLERLKQHAILSCHLDPFTAQQTQNYIEFRLAKAGLPEQTIFTPDAISEIYDRSRGFATAIHAICEGLLLAAFSARSKVCTPEILDQVFRRPSGEEAQVEETAGTVVAVTRIDLGRLAAPADPEPPVLTILLPLTFAAIQALPPPLPVKANGMGEPQRVTLSVLFPTRVFALLVREFAWGPREPMRLMDARTASSIEPEIHAIPCTIAVLNPVLSKPAVLAEPRAESKLQGILPNIRPNIHPKNVALMAPFLAVPTTPIDFASVALQPANSAVESLKARTALLTPRGVNKLSRLSCTVQPNSGILRPVVEPPAPATGLHTVIVTPTDFTGSLHHPGTSGGEARSAVAPGIPNTLFSLPCSIEPRAVAAGAPAVLADDPVSEQAGSASVAPSLQPAQPKATLQPAGTIRLPRVPVTPFRIAPSDPPSPRTSGDSEVHLTPQNPPAPPMGTGLTAFGESRVAARNHLLSLACTVPPSAPAAETPIKTFLDPLPSLRPHGPVSKLEAVNPRSSWLLLPSWKPADTEAAAAVEPVVEAEKPFSFHPAWLIALAIPILSVLALYGWLSGTLPTSNALNRTWERAHRAVLDRAAVALREDFRTGLDDWMNRGGVRPSWTSDAAGFVHPGALALYRPSLSLVDYQMQFVGTIDKKALSWVVRAADFNNYYAVRLAVLKPGPVPTIGVTRYAVINGKTQNQVTKPLLMSARSDTVYRVTLDVHGDHYALSVQDQPVDSWSEPKLAQGGVGFFSDQDAASRVTAVQVKGQYDLLGRLCAFLAPSAVTSYRASLSERAALNLTADMNARSAGRGGFNSSFPTYIGRLPRGTARLDPTFWQVPEVNVPNARRCGPGSGRAGVVRPKRTLPYTGASSSTNCY